MRTPSYRTLRKAFLDIIMETAKLPNRVQENMDISHVLEGMRLRGIDLDGLPSHPYDRYYMALGLEAMGEEMAEKHSNAVERILEMMSHDPLMIQYINAAFILCGKNTFKMRRDLYEMFERTDLKGVMPTFIPPAPFECFYLDTTGCGIWFCRSKDGCPVEANGLFVVCVRTETGEGAHADIRFVMWAKESQLLSTRAKATDIGEEDYQAAKAFIKEEKARGANDVQWSDAHLISGLQYRVATDGTPVADILDNAYRHTFNSLEKSKDKCPPYYTRLQSQAVKSGLSLIFNVLLFLGTDPALMLDEHAAERKKLLKMYRAGVVGHKDITQGGKKAHQRLIEISSTNVRLLSAPVRGKTSHQKTGAETTGVRLHWVRGHWRRQPYGPRDAPEYKMLWIQPHQKGDAASGEVVGKTYTW